MSDEKKSLRDKRIDKRMIKEHFYERSAVKVPSSIMSLNCCRLDLTSYRFPPVLPYTPQKLRTIKDILVDK